MNAAMHDDNLSRFVLVGGFLVALIIVLIIVRLLVR